LANRSKRKAKHDRKSGKKGGKFCARSARKFLKIPEPGGETDKDLISFTLDAA
jgi:hypothetical protein